MEHWIPFGQWERSLFLLCSLSHPSSPLNSPQMLRLLPRSLTMFFFFFFCPFCSSHPLLRIPCSHASVYLGRVRLGRAHQTTLSLNPSTKSSIFAIALQRFLLFSVPVSSQHIVFSTFQVLVFMHFFQSLIKAPQMTLLLAASGQLHINIPFPHWMSSEFLQGSFTAESIRTPVFHLDQSWSSWSQSAPLLRSNP